MNKFWGMWAYSCLTRAEDCGVTDQGDTGGHAVSRGQWSARSRRIILSLQCKDYTVSSVRGLYYHFSARIILSLKCYTIASVRGLCYHFTAIILSLQYEDYTIASVRGLCYHFSAMILSLKCKDHTITSVRGSHYHFSAIIL